MNSTIYGAIMGSLLLGLFKRENKKHSLEEEEKIKT
jgi:hypothetical protein